VIAAQDARMAPSHDAARLPAPQRAELDEFFARAEAGPVPDSEYCGTLILPLDIVPLRGVAA
jgi:hypothetical protein